MQGHFGNWKESHFHPAQPVDAWEESFKVTPKRYESKNILRKNSHEDFFKEFNTLHKLNKDYAQMFANGIRDTFGNEGYRAEIREKKNLSTNEKERFYLLITHKGIQIYPFNNE